MEVQGEKLEWLNRTEPEVLLDKDVDLQEKDKLSNCLQSLNVRWNKVCISLTLGIWSWKYSSVLGMVVILYMYLWHVYKMSCKPCRHSQERYPNPCLNETLVDIFPSQWVSLATLGSFVLVFFCIGFILYGLSFKQLDQEYFRWSKQ